MAIRKDANSLTAAERTEFVTAILELKTSGIYDQFVLRHANANMSAIHSAPAFLPWHRRFILDYERELQRLSGNPDLGLPYWNWPQGGANASIWDDNLLGGDGSALNQIVTTGPFRQGQWTVVNMGGGPAGPLTRAFGRSGLPTLPTQAEIDQVGAVTPYDRPPWNRSSNPSFRNELEGWRGPNLHNRGHVWVGGSMLPMTSPNDPVFFMHHCMVDKVWHDWQLRFPNQGYLPVFGGPFGQNLNDPMDSTPSGPIGNRPIDVLDNAALNVHYDGVIIEPGPRQPLIVNGATFNASIGSAGEVDEYTFGVTAFGSITIETSGSSDTVIALFGPDDPSNQLAFNDDGGVNLNSRIVRNLSSGNYVVRVGLWSANATGNYAIGVSSAAGPAITELIVDDPALDTAISAGSESDMYRFQAQSQGDYVIETSGPTDTFMTLFGPGSQTNQIAQNDDGGFSLNSRISRQLDAGEYFVRVRHFSTFGTGPYQVSVRQV